MNTSNTLSSNCSCGTNEVRLSSAPLARFVCHCTICQKVYKQAYADFVVAKADTVDMDTEQNVVYKRHRMPPALQRGTCVKCHQPVIARLKLMGLLNLAFIPVQNFDDESLLPEPSAHLFYNRAQQSIDDGLPKLEGYLASEWYVTKTIIRQLT